MQSGIGLNYKVLCKNCSYAGDDWAAYLQHAKAKGKHHWHYKLADRRTGEIVEEDSIDHTDLP